MNRQIVDQDFQEKSMEDLTMDDILSMRTTLDKISVTLLKERKEDDPRSFLNIDFPNKFLIESFNYFGITGLREIFDNFEFNLGDMLISVASFSLMSPRANEISKPDEYLFPNQALMGEISYLGDLNISLLINQPNTEPWMIESFPFAKIPIMVGSAFCNLTNDNLIRTVEDYKKVGGCPTEYLGYFIMKGNKHHFISQNYLKDNNPICRTRYHKDDEERTSVYSICDLKSRGLNGTIYKTAVFVMTSRGSKLSRNDSRLYVQVGGLVRKNFYPTLSWVPEGMNLMDLFRLSHALSIYLDPFMPGIAYDFMRPKIDENLHGNFVFSFAETFTYGKELFKTVLHKHLGDEVYEMAHIYIENTINEASITYSEKDYWHMMAQINNPAIVTENSIISPQEQAAKVLFEFGKSFLPHISSITFENLYRDLLNAKEQIRYNLQEWIKAKTPPQNLSVVKSKITIEIIPDIDLALYAIKGKYESLNPAQKKKIQEWDIASFLSLPGVIQITERYNLFTKDLNLKREMLGHMSSRLIRTILELDPVDDINSLGNQVYDPAGELMLSRFSSMLRDISSELSKKEFTDRSENRIKKLFQTLGENSITKQYAASFASNEWNKISKSRKNSKMKTRTGIRDIMPTTGPVAEISALRRLSSQSPDQSTSLEDREIGGLQTGYICPAETSEGKQCGRVVHLAAAAIITGHSYDDKVWAVKLAAQRSSNVRRASGDNREIENPVYYQYTKQYTLNTFRNIIRDENEIAVMPEEERRKFPISTSPSKQRKCFFMLDGIPMGWVDGLSMRRNLIQFRRNGIIHPMTGIHFSQRIAKGGLYQILKMETRPGRIVQPLIIAEDPQKTLNLFWHLHEQAKRGYIYTVGQLFEAGFVEFIDSAELEFLDLSPSGSDYLRSLQDGNPYRYDHIMLNPSFLMGITSNMQPFSNMNPPVRNAYFSAMQKQASSAITASFVNRADTSVSRLLTAQKPLVDTDIYDAVFDDNYFGMNVNVLVTTHLNNEEDGIVVREGFVKNGGLSSTKYEAYPITLKSNERLDFGGEVFFDSLQEHNEDPDRYGKGVIRVKKQVVTTDPETGEETITEVPVIVNSKDILARAMSGDSNEQELYSDTEYDSLREGVVDRIMWSKGSEKSRIVYIIVKLADNLWNGDKLASRHSQKGVIVSVVPDNQLFRDARTGEVPDIIINPQAFPSRMTVGMMAEMTVGTAYSRPDLNKTVSILYNQKGFDILGRVERLFIVNTDEYKRRGNDIEEFMELSPVLYPSNTRLSPTSLMSSQSGKRSNPSSPQYQSPTSSTTTLISSVSVYSQEQLDALRELDLGVTLGEQEEGILALKVYGTPKPIEEIVQNAEDPDDVEPTKDIRYILIVLTNSGNEIKQVPLNDERVQAWYKISPELRARMAFVLEVPRSFMDDIPGLFEDGEQQNPMKGIKISDLPDHNVPMENNILSHLGNTVRDVYIRGNSYTPVARQMICDYRDIFFTRKNLEFYYIDYIIPDNMLTLSKVKMNGEQDYKEVVLDSGRIKYSILEAESVKVEAIEERLESELENAKMVETVVETTLFELWNRTYDNNMYIPRQNIIDLPNNPSKLFEVRKDKIEALRKGNSFKEGNVLSNANKELAMMGYNMDMTKRYIDMKTGREVEGGLVNGSIYYMALKHKVKDKIQARGIGRFDMRLGQPVKGKINGGGMRFNHQDSLTVRRTGANAVLLDRLRDASGGKIFYVCQNCENICHKIDKGEREGSVVCKTCQTQGTSVKIHIPYVTMYMLKLLKGAGLNYKLKTKLLKGEGEGENQ